MIVPSQALTFAGTILLVGIVPGPAMLYVAAEALYGGRRAGLQSVLGVHIGAYVHVLAAASGLALLFHTFPAALAVIQFAGALYLVFIGLKMLKTRHLGRAVPEPSARPPRQTLWRSIAVEALNPKSAIFFMALLPQFACPDAAMPVPLQLLLLGIVANILLSGIETGVVLTAGIVRHRVKTAAQSAALARLAGGVLIVCLGVHLALSPL
ncbi:LysE family translocator [Gellertiella hungarica]|uniref:Threonine/homoserine/homoserine lactone efflux protein n=1 Tax=Gellertiella hungarica TaxID=1572859 RepID=A0A7W6J485_9HYPH|nr:LysE family translocator [Gellertiella hungarica]MBB4064485.1 threonine/homoserine/homoserine lactone efflux protein [Gellertiella hungarica]